MTLEQLAKLGQQMRAAQKAYFRTRTASALGESKTLEKRFDQACKEATDQPRLFGGDMQGDDAC